MAIIMNRLRDKEKRRMLRKQQTPEEKLLWEMLRRKRTGLKWRRQTGIGSYVADFYCPSKKLVIELDGGQHKDMIGYDTVRDKFFHDVGIRVIRISNKIFNGDLEIVYQKIIKSLEGETLS